MGYPDWVSVDPDPGSTVGSLGPGDRHDLGGTHPVSADLEAVEHCPACSDLLLSSSLPTRTEMNEKESLGLISTTSRLGSKAEGVVTQGEQYAQGLGGPH